MPDISCNQRHLELIILKIDSTRALDNKSYDTIQFIIDSSHSSGAILLLT